MQRRVIALTSPPPQCLASFRGRVHQAQGRQQERGRRDKVRPPAAPRARARARPGADVPSRPAPHAASPPRAPALRHIPPPLIHSGVAPCLAVMAAPNGRVFQFKLVLLGDSAVGKSSLVLRFVRGQFFEYQESTIGAAFLTQTVALNDTTVKFEIWDTAGQERYHSLAPMYYRGAAAAIVVFDITNRDTFQRAKQWVKELQRQGNPNIVIALAGNKSDLSSKRKVEPEEAESYASDNGVFFMETSAKTATNVNELFVAIARKLPKNTPQPRPGAQGIVIAQNQGAAEQKKGCC